MTNGITCRNIIQRLEENSLNHELIKFDEEKCAVILERGGRILGPFTSMDKESILWVNPSFAESSLFKKFLESGDWNIGGGRLWIAPELQHNCKDRKNFSEGYMLPKQADPGNY
ncbi:MAG: hypothetical protein ACYCXQ_08095 [Candidatus Humimicrobiaceae bacterium]